jgi:valyl-tRNA synthetase
MARVEGNRNFCNKLWNAARYVLMNVAGEDVSAEGARFSLSDRWIRSRLAHMLKRVDAGFTEYRLDGVASALYEFTWNEYCDWYLELSKAVLFSDTASAADKRGTRYTLIHTLEVLLRALHPLAPFISEEIWQKVRVSARASGETIMLSSFPMPDTVPADTEAESEMRWVMGFIDGVRQIRGEMDIAPSRKLDRVAPKRDTHGLGLRRTHTCRISFDWRASSRPQALAQGQTAPISAVALLGTLEVLVPMAGLIEPQAELERLAKRQRKTDADLGKLEAKMANADFVRNAPPGGGREGPAASRGIAHRIDVVDRPGGPGQAITRRMRRTSGSQG